MSGAPVPTGARRGPWIVVVFLAVFVVSGAATWVGARASAPPARLAGLSTATPARNDESLPAQLSAPSPTPSADPTLGPTAPTAAPTADSAGGGTTRRCLPNTISVLDLPPNYTL